MGNINKNNKLASHGKFTPIIMLVIGVLFFIFQFIIRLFPGLTSKELMQQIMLNGKSIDAGLFGIIMSSYYYGYTVAHIPIAKFFDKYGPRVVIVLCSVSCGIFSYLFAHTTNFYVAILYRFLVGCASAAGLLGTLKIASLWFDEKNYSKMTGISIAIGFLGALYGGAPTNKMLDSLGYNTLVFALSIVSVFIGVIVLLFFKSPNNLSSCNNNNCNNENGGELKTLLSSKLVWMLGLSNLLIVGALEGFADVWGVEYLIKAYNVSKTESAGLCSIIFMGMLVGSFAIGLIASIINNFIGIAVCGILISILFFIFMFIQVNTALLPIIFFSIGFCCSYQILIFSVCPKIVTMRFLGLATAFMNGINMLGGAYFHTAIGYVMNFFWDGTKNNNMPVYSIKAFNYALLIIPISAIIGSIMCIYVYKASKNMKKIGE